MGIFIELFNDSCTSEYFLIEFYLFPLKLIDRRKKNMFLIDEKHHWSFRFLVRSLCFSFDMFSFDMFSFDKTVRNVSMLIWHAIRDQQLNLFRANTVNYLLLTNNHHSGLHFNSVCMRFSFSLGIRILKLDFLCHSKSCNINEWIWLLRITKLQRFSLLARGVFGD